MAGFNNNGQLNLGKSLIQNGMLTFANSSNNNVITLQPASSGTGSNTVTLPNETGQICTTAGSAACTAVYAAASGSGAYVNLQAATPGTVQTGNLNISGAAIAGSFSGNGANLTSLNGSNISSGTVASAYLPNNITYQGNSFNGVSQLVQTNASGNISIAGSIGTASALYTPLLDTTSAGTLSIGTSNASSITLGKASQGQVSIPGGINTGGNSISTGGGSISTSNGSLNLGTGTITTSGAIQGGAISGTTGNFSSTLGVTGLLTANGGITTNNGNANFGTGTITSGAINGATISGGTLSNTGVGGSGAFTVSSGGSGSLNLSSGSGNVSTGTNTINGQTISSAANFTGTLGVTGTVTAASFSGNGASLTSLNGANIQGGTVANTALQNSSVTIANGTNVTGGGTVSLGGTLTVGTVNNPTFSTSVTTPSLTSTGSLTISSASSTNLSLNGVTVSNSGAISNVSSLAASGNISTSAGSISGVGISAGTGSFTGTGGATISGATSINTTGSGSTNIGTGTNIGTTTIGNSSGGSTILQGSIGVNGTATFGNSANLVLGTGSAVSYASSSTANFDLSNSSGVFKTTTGAVTLQGSTNTINGVTNINTGSSVATGVNIGTGSTYTGTISIANGSGASTVNIGNSSSTLNLQGSTNTINGATSINASANNNTNINTGNSTGQVNIGNSSTSSINITSGSTGGITLNGGSANSTLVLQGTNANLNSYAICTALSSTCNSTYQVSGNYAQLGSSNTFTGSNNTLNATSSNALTVQNTSSAVALNVNTSNNSVGMNGQLSVPTGVTAGTPTSGGTLAASTTYTIEVTALDGAGNQTTPSTSTTKATTASNKTIPVSWNAVTNAISYNVYYSSNGGTSWAYYNVASGTSYSLAAASGTSATPPSFNSAFVNDFTSSTNSLTATKFYGQTSVTSSSASAFLVQANSSATLLLANNSTSVSNIGNGATSYTGQLFIGVQSTAFTGQFTGQRLYVDSAQITGTTLIGSYTGTATCDSSSDNNSGNYVYFNFSFEPYLCGSARHSRQISYSPEYNDTVLSPSSGNTSGGSIITGYDSGNDHNYYQWSTSSSSTQGFDLYLHIHVPSDFSAWSVNSIGASAGQLCAQLNITGVSSPTVSASILTSAFNSLAPSSSPISFAKPQNNTWTSTCVTIFPATVTANSYITVNLHLATDVNSNIKLGELYIPYASKF